YTANIFALTDPHETNSLAMPASNVRILGMTKGNLMPYEADAGFSYEGKDNVGNFLPNGQYFIDVRLTDEDQLNTTAESSFTVLYFSISRSTAPPSLMVYDINGALIADGGISTTPSVTLVATSSGTNLADVGFDDDSTGAGFTQTVPPATAHYVWNTPPLQDGDFYDAYTNDVANNVT